MYRKIIISLIVLALIPVAFAYIPQGEHIWFNVSPSTNTTLGGVYSFECSIGELPFAVYENGTFDCAVP